MKNVLLAFLLLSVYPLWALAAPDTRACCILYRNTDKVIESCKANLQEISVCDDIFRELRLQRDRAGYLRAQQEASKVVKLLGQVFGLIILGGLFIRSRINSDGMRIHAERVRAQQHKRGPSQGFNVSDHSK